MQVHFKKDAEGNFILHCIRNDGTSTWQKYSKNVLFQVEHDLIHFAVETILGFKDAFYGILASGKDISWFEQAEASGKKPRVGLQGMYGEIFSGELQRLKNNDQFVESLPAILEQYKLPPWSLTLDQIKSIRAKAAHWLERWKQSESGITLEFPG